MFNKCEELLVKKITFVCAVRKNYLPKYSPINHQHLGIPRRTEDIPEQIPKSYPQAVENVFGTSAGSHPPG